MIQNHFFTYTVFLGLFLIVVNVTGFPFGDDPLKPSRDPFYVPEAGFENEQPGTILKSRILSCLSLPLPLRLVTQEFHQFLYRTTDSLDKPIATVTTLLVPRNGDPKKLVSYQTPEDSGTLDCAPSYSLQGYGDRGIQSIGGLAVIEGFLSKGWYVNIPDHEGLDSYFLSGPNAAHCVLDSIRAVILTGNQFKFGPDTRIQMMGYSGGAHATGWATQLKDSYAPELNIVGSAYGGTPVDIDANIQLVNKGASSGFIFAGLPALGRQYAPYGDYLNQALLPEKKQAFMDGSNYCVTSLLKKYKYQDAKSYSGRDDFFNNAAYNKVMADSLMGKIGPPKFPVLMFHAKNDQTVPYESALKMYNDWCARNSASLTFDTYTWGSHASVAVASFPRVLNFLKDMFDGVAYDVKCKSQTVPL